VSGSGREDGELLANCLDSGDASCSGLELGENPGAGTEVGEKPEGVLDDVDAPEGGREKGDKSGSYLFNGMLSIDGLDVGDAVGGLLDD